MSALTRLGDEVRSVTAWLAGAALAPADPGYDAARRSFNALCYAEARD